MWKKASQTLTSSKSISLFIWTALVFTILLLAPKYSKAASLYLDPASGEFNVGETFQVSIILDTEKETVNTVETSLIFPADRLQIVSPTIGSSIINIYTTPPKFDNKNGRIDVAGGIPGGVTTAKGLITTLTFRVTASGKAGLRFLSNSKALLHDGKGTDALHNTQGASYQLVLPPPNGPLVNSETHPDQEKWYNLNNSILSWQSEQGTEGYSFEISGDPISLPDDTVDSTKNSIIYKNLSDGVHYFHIKALRGGVWGGITHFGIRVDTTPPAGFPIDIYPATRTDSERPVIEFSTSDQSSGISHYEVKVVPLDQKETIDQFFIEAASPYTPGHIDHGAYSVIVRAYDQAGNFTETNQRLDIVLGVSRYFGPDGLYITKNIYIQWKILLPSLAGLILLLLFLALWFHKKHKHMEASSELPYSVKEQLKELQEYRSRYGKMATLCLIGILTSLYLLSPSSTALAQEIETQASLAAPLITSYSEKINDKEIFYVSGRTNEANTEIELQLQNLYDGQTFEFKTKSDKRGDWLYRHSGFLSAGEYIVWAQAVRGNELSTPSAQSKIEVQAVALSLSGQRITKEMIYIALVTILLFTVLLLGLYLILIIKAGRKKRQLLQTELTRAEESIRQGFQSLKHDLQLELAIVKKAGLSGELAGEERIREEELEKDLLAIEKYVSDEILETKALEGM